MKLVMFRSPRSPRVPERYFPVPMKLTLSI